MISYLFLVSKCATTELTSWPITCATKRNSKFTVWVPDSRVLRTTTALSSANYSKFVVRNSKFGVRTANLPSGKICRPEQQICRPEQQIHCLSHRYSSLADDNKVTVWVIDKFTVWVIDTRVLRMQCTITQLKRRQSWPLSKHYFPISFFFWLVSQWRNTSYDFSLKLELWLLCWQSLAQIWLKWPRQQRHRGASATQSWLQGLCYDKWHRPSITTCHSLWQKRNTFGWSKQPERSSRPHVTKEQTRVEVMLTLRSSLQENEEQSKEQTIIPTSPRRPTATINRSTDSSESSTKKRSELLPASEIKECFDRSERHKKICWRVIFDIWPVCTWYHHTPFHHVANR